ncbi:MAG: 30S ribosomal protein S4e [Candidatus Thermoplasmatota archaeon]
MSKHLKRSNAARTLRLHRKEKKWTIRPSPGPHPIENSVSLGLIIRDYLSLADTKKEVKRILSNGEIFVDGTQRKDYRYPCGLMDVINIPKIKKHYRLLYDRKGKFRLMAISEMDAEWKLSRIENKSLIKDGKIQLNLHDGHNKIVEQDKYKTGDVLKINFKENKIIDVFSFEKGKVALIIGGKHIGEIADIKDVEIVRSSHSNLVRLEGKNEFSTIKKHVFTVGKEKPVIEVPEVKM